MKVWNGGGGLVPMICNPRCRDLGLQLFYIYAGTRCQPLQQLNEDLCVVSQLADTCARCSYIQFVQVKSQLLWFRQWWLPWTAPLWAAQWCWWGAHPSPSCLVLFQYCPTPLKGANRTGVGAQTDVICVAVGRDFISYCWSCLVTASPSN